MTFTHPGPIAGKFVAQTREGLGSDDTSADAVIEQAVRSMLADLPLSKTASIEIAARDGVVTLDGTVSDGLWLARFKNQLTSALPSITIDDRLEWVVPECGIGFI